MLRKAKGASVDALALTFVRIITVLISMVIYKLLAVSFSAEEYGTYASVMLVSTTATSLTILGLTDAINYFYAKDRDSENSKTFVYTIFAIQLVVGICAAAGLILFRGAISTYFNNPIVGKLIPLVAFLPMLTNFSNMLQILFVTEKKAKVIAIRNLIIAFLKIFAVAGTCFFLKNIQTVIFVMLVLEVGNVIYMLAYCRRYIFTVDVKKADPYLVKQILMYSVPMAAYILTNAMSKNIDKLVVGALGSSEMMGVYSMAAKELPFDILTTSFLTVLIPYITRYMGTKEYESASDVFSKYIQITYIVTWIIAGGALVCSKELMLILYDVKYLSGIVVFCIYIIVDMMKFTTVSLIFSVASKAKQLLGYSCIALVANAVLSIIFFRIWGMVGPAAATLLTTFLLGYVMMAGSARLLSTNIFRLLHFKQMMKLIAECLICGVIATVLKCYIGEYIGTLATFIICYGVFAMPLMFINRRRIIQLLKEINKAKC